MTYHNAYAAKVEDNFVREVIVIPYCNDDDVEITAYCNSIGLEGTWLDCSYLASRRFHFPGPGFAYDAGRDAFIPPKPFDSWVLNEATCLWEAPVPKPEGNYEWDESAGDWVAVPEPAE